MFYIIFFLLTYSLFAQEEVLLDEAVLGSELVISDSMNQFFNATPFRFAFQTANQIQQGQGGLGASVQQGQSGGTRNRITVSGHYVLVEDLTIPGSTNGIIIDTDNVILDLNSRTITGQTTSLNGILILGNRSNILILNGTIRNMGNAGILMNGTVNQLGLENMRFFRNNVGANMAGVRNCLINACQAFQNTNSGFSIAQSGNTQSQGFLINECLSSFNGSDGFQCTNCSNMIFARSIATNNRFRGFAQISGNQITILQCIAHTNGTIGIFSTGNNHTIAECQSNNNASHGYQLNGNRHNLRLCEAKQNVGSGIFVRGTNHVINESTSTQNTSHGFDLSGNQQITEQCKAISNQANGFQIALNNHMVLNCLATNNINAGIFLAASSNQCQVRSNTALSNGVGIQNVTNTVNRIYSNFASNNTTANFIGVPNVFTSPGVFDPINFTSNIAN